MATPRHQRVFIWIIAAVMAVGTLGAYFVVILANNNGEVPVSEASLKQQEEEYQKFIEEYQKQMEEGAKARMAASGPIEGYQADKFDAGSVTSLQKTELTVGTGRDVAPGSTVNVSYFGWLPDGTIFDSTTQNGTNTPAENFALTEESGLIKGWIDGIPGMKVGGVRKLVIPVDQAYGPAGSPPTIPGNTPLSFIIRIESVAQ